MLVRGSTLPQQHELEVFVEGILGSVHRHHEAFAPVKESSAEYIRAHEGPSAAQDSRHQRGAFTLPVQHSRAVARVAVHLAERILEVANALVHEQSLQPSYLTIDDQALVHSVVAESGRSAPEKAHQIVWPPACMPDIATAEAGQAPH